MAVCPLVLGGLASRLAKAVFLAAVATDWVNQRLIDYEQGRDLDGYVWGVKGQALYPGMKLLPSVQASSGTGQSLVAVSRVAEVWLSGS